MMRSPRLLLIIGLIVAVAMVLLGLRMRVMLAGGKAIFVLAIIAGLLWIAYRPKHRKD